MDEHQGQDGFRSMLTSGDKSQRGWRPSQPESISLHPSYKEPTLMRLSPGTATEADTARGCFGFIEALPEGTFRYALQPTAYAAHF
jgi:hypothetical protein